MQTKADCVHHWIIEVAQGKTSYGRCEKCDEVREFSNSIEDRHFALVGLSRVWVPKEDVIKEDE